MDQSGAFRRLRSASILAMVIVAAVALVQGALVYWGAARTPVATYVYESAQRARASAEVLFCGERLAEGPSAVAAFDRALADLRQQQTALSDLDPGDLRTYDAFIAAARALQRRPNDAAAHARLRALGRVLIGVFDRRTQAYVAVGDARRKIFYAFSTFGVATILLVLLVAYAFVFRPGERYARDALARELERSEHYRPLFENSPNAIVEIGADGIIRGANAQFVTMLGYAEDELAGRHFTVLVTQGRKVLATARMREMLGGGLRTFEGFLLCKNGTEIAAEITPTPLRRGASIGGIFMRCRDLTRDLALANPRADTRLKGLYHLISSTADISLTIDEALRFGTIELNMPYGYVTELTGNTVTILHRYGPGDLLPRGSQFPATDAIGHRIAASARAVAVEDLTRNSFAAELDAVRLPWKSYIGSRIFVDGILYGAMVFLSESVRATPFTDADLDFIDLLSGVIGSSVAREIHQTHLKALASHDSLTHLANRRTLEEHAARALAHARRSGDMVALHYIDLDDFKPINDRYGHALGDEVLVETAQRLASVLRADDLLARIGGDEFVALQGSVESQAAAQTLARRLVEAVSPPIRLSSGDSVTVSASLGSAIAPEDGETFDALVDVADRAMYAAKLAHRKRARA